MSQLQLLGLLNYWQPLNFEHYTSLSVHNGLGLGQLTRVQDSVNVWWLRYFCGVSYDPIGVTNGRNF